MTHSRSVMDLAGAPWVDLLPTMPKGNKLAIIEKKMLTAPDGLSVGLIHIDGPHPPHFHTKTSTLFHSQRPDRVA